MQPVTINGGYVMRAWYDIGYQDLSLREDEKGVRDSQHAHRGDSSSASASAASVPSSCCWPGSPRAARSRCKPRLRYPARLAGVLALSTYLPLPDKLESERSAANQDVPILMAHGIEDPIVPLKLAQASCSRLLTLGYPVQWHEYEMPHSVCPEELDHIGAFLREVLVYAFVTLRRRASHT